MSDSSIRRADAEPAAAAAAGPKLLVSGKHVAMRLWDIEPGGAPPSGLCAYETVGLVIAGRAELVIEGQVIPLRPGDAWVVPKGAEHSYRIFERFQAVEATAPPAQSIPAADGR